MFEIQPKLKKKANIQSTIRFPEVLWDDLHQFAAEYNVSFNYLVLQCCDYALKNMVKSDDETK